MATQFIALIGKLYQIEAQAKRDGLDTSELGRLRQRASKAVLADIETLLLANLHSVLPKSLLGQRVGRVPANANQHHLNRVVKPLDHAA